MTARLVWLADRLVALDEARVSVLDLGLRSGLGVFETLRADTVDGEWRLLAPEQHRVRMIAGALRLGIATPADVSELGATFDTALKTLLAHVSATSMHDPHGIGGVVLRCTLTAGSPEQPDAWPLAAAGRPLLIVTHHQAPALPLPPAGAVTVAARRWPADVKSTSYVASVLATREARARGGEIALLCDGEEVLESAEGNVFALVDDTLCTPAADGRLLDGVTRNLVLGAAEGHGFPTRVGPLTIEELRRSERAFVTSAVQGIRSLDSVDGISIDGAPHPMVSALREALRP
jgi:branched-subunit amino acid aminotransferase/4-amino-4-deoxychorismate lyase